MRKCFRFHAELKAVASKVRAEGPKPPHLPELREALALVEKPENREFASKLKNETTAIMLLISEIERDEANRRAAEEEAARKAAEEEVARHVAEVEAARKAAEAAAAAATLAAAAVAASNVGSLVSGAVSACTPEVVLEPPKREAEEDYNVVPDANTFRVLRQIVTPSKSIHDVVIAFFLLLDVPENNTKVKSCVVSVGLC